MRFSARMTGAALVVTAALALTGCNSHSSTHHGKKHKSSSSKHRSSRHVSSTPWVHASSVAGNWQTGSIADGDYVAMVLKETEDDTRVAVLNARGGGLCKGTYEQSGHYVHISTSCKTDQKFDSGNIKKYKNGKLTVKWDAAGTDTFTKAGDDAPTQ